MKRIFIFVLILIIYLLLTSCSGNPVPETSYLITESWIQIMTNDVEYEIKIQNLTCLPLTGNIVLEFECSDGSSYEEKVKFSEIPAFSSSTEKGEKGVDNKNVDDMTIDEKNIIYK